MSITKNMLYATRIEDAGSSFDPVYNIPFFQEQRAKISAILPCDASNKRNFSIAVSLKYVVIIEVQ